MRTVIQRVSSASVVVEGQAVGQIERGFLILLGVHENDTQKEAAYLAEKCAGLRVFEDAEGKMNLPLSEVGGSVLVVSNFTLYGDCKKGRRPNFTAAARPETAQPLYEFFCQEMQAKGLLVQTGIFGADMKITLTNDGPVTLMLDTRDMLSR